MIPTVAVHSDPIILNPNPNQRSGVHDGDIFGGRCRGRQMPGGSITTVFTERDRQPVNNTRRRYDTIRDAILTCAQKLTQASLI